VFFPNLIGYSHRDFISSEAGKQQRKQRESSSEADSLVELLVATDI
jgi:hypothetical protein